MKHLSQKQCIDLMLGLITGKKAGYFASHIKNCAECRERLDAFLPVIKPDIKNKVRLSKDLKKRILNSAVQIRESNNGQIKYNSLKHKILRPAVLYSAIAAGTIAIFFVFFSFTEFNSNSAFLHVARMYGKADINSIPARTHDMVSSGNTISTDDDSVMMLRSSRDYRIMIISKSSVTVEKARLNNNKDLEVKYSLDNGIIYNKHNDEDTPVRYAFTTPNALINAEDADMMLKVSNKTSSILLIKGKIVIHDLNSSNNIVINLPGRYIISDGIKTTKQQDATIPNSQKIDEAFTLHENADESIIPADNFIMNPTYESDSFKNVNKTLIRQVKSMMPE